jgi:cobalt-zinc-cadmium efflux system outer membrane protein
MATRVWCVSVLMGGAIWLASGSADAQTLSEADALARLSADSPRVRAARAGIDVARANVLTASRWPNPRFTFDRESVAGITENLVMVGQVLPISGRRGFDRSAAFALLDAVSSRSEDDVRRLRADLRMAFAELVAAQEREGELIRARGRLRELTETLSRREAAGDAAGFDRLRAEREVLDIETDLAIAAADRQRAQRIVTSFLPPSPSTSTTLVADVVRPAAAPLPDLDALVSRAGAVRGELIALRHERDAAAFAERAAERRLVPEPEVIAGTKSSTLDGGDVGSVFTVQTTIPLFDRGKPERALAQAKAAQANARAEAFQITLRGQISAWRAAVIDRRQAADRYRFAAVRGSDEIERIAQVSYEAGERGILELLDAYRTGVAARVRQVMLDAGTRQAEIELEFVSGWEVP